MSIVVYMACKSNVSVNHLHLHVQIFHTYTDHVAVYMCFTCTITQSQYKYLLITLRQPCVNVLGHVNINTKIICKITLSLGLLSPQKFLSRVSIK
jgi:hypothetical protein